MNDKWFEIEKEAKESKEAVKELKKANKESTDVRPQNTE